MPRLLFDGEWYEPLAADSMFETDYESLLLDRAEDLYPSFHMVRFKRKVFSEYGNGVPDLALIDHEYRAWWVVEVELGSHSLSGHVESQVQVFSRAKYGQEDAAFLASNASHLDGAKLEQMMRGTQPRVLVIVNQARPEWTTWLRKYDALVGVAEMFRGRNNRIVLRVNGEHPEPLPNVLSRCTVDALLPRAFVVSSPANLPCDAQSVDLEYQGAVSRWKRVEVRDRVWLVPERRSPLPAGVRSCDIIRRADGRLVLLDTTAQK